MFHSNKPFLHRVAMVTNVRILGILRSFFLCFDVLLFLWSLLRRRLDVFFSLLLRWLSTSDEPDDEELSLSDSEELEPELESSESDPLLL